MAKFYEILHIEAYYIRPFQAKSSYRLNMMDYYMGLRRTLKIEAPLL